MRGESTRNLRAAAALLGGPTVLLAALSMLRFAGAGPERAEAGPVPARIMAVTEPRTPGGSWQRPRVRRSSLQRSSAVFCAAGEVWPPPVKESL